MSLDITFTQRKNFVCPKCGEIVGHTDVDYKCSSGRSWYPFLESIGYYVPYEQRTEENDWYGKDMVLTNEQVDEAYRFTRENALYRADEVRSLIAVALLEKDSIVINANW